VSGIYAFFLIDINTGWLIITIGKCEDKEKRLKDYRVGNAGTIFHYFKEVPKNQLTREENKLKNFLKKNGLKLFEKAHEQFIVEDEIKTRELLNEYLGKEINKPFKNIDYNVATLDGETLDIRNLRPMSDFIPGELAMTTTKAGLGEKYRKVTTRFVPNGKGITELTKPEPKYIDEKAWDVWQAATKNALFEHKQKKGPFS